MTLAEMCQKIVAHLDAMPCQCKIDDGEMKRSIAESEITTLRFVPSMKQCYRCQAIDAAKELSETIFWGELE